jgi:GntR family transcriptional regulator, transcriptional repressor for pyruvate dehydrogenase complex
MLLGRSVKVGEIVMSPSNGSAFQPIRRATVPGKVIGQIRDLMATGRLKPGLRLPSERTLAQILGVGRSTMREAIRAMESFNMVHVRAGDGTYLAAPALCLAGSDPTALFNSGDSEAKLFEARSLLEPEVAAVSARRATPEQIDRMHAMLVEQEAGIGLGEPGTDEDHAFHSLVVEAAGNEVLVHILRGITNPFRVLGREGFLQPKDAVLALRRNAAILETIEHRRPEDAGQRMREDLWWPAIHPSIPRRD